MKTIREKFEGLPEINKTMVSYDISFDGGSYNSPFSHINEWMNGAWYAFQEQQKKIDLVLQYIHDEKWMDEYGDYHCPVLKIQEILK